MVIGRNPVRYRTAIAGTAALLVLLAAGSGMRVQAACGDHVQYRRPGTSSQPAPAELPPLPALPCHGPQCSRGGGVPLLPPAPPPPTSQERWGEAVVLLAPATAEPTGRLLDDISDRPILRPPEIFHPPRQS